MHSLSLVVFLCLGVVCPANAQTNKGKPKRPITNLPKVITGKRKGRLVLPSRRPQPQQPSAQQAPVQRNSLEQFRRDVMSLRRSRRAPINTTEAVLRDLRERYDDPAAMALRLLPKVKADQIFGLMKVLRRYGPGPQRKKHAMELHFLLLTRLMGDATEDVVQTSLALNGEQSKSRLFELLEARFAPVRVAASKLLVDYVADEDLPQLLRLSRVQKADVRRLAVRLLGVLKLDKSRQRLVQVLQRTPALAGEACRSLVRHGLKAVPELQTMVNQPASGIEYGYAALALAMIEDASGKNALKLEMLPHLMMELTGREPFMQVTSAVAIASLAYRTDADKLRVDGKPIDHRKVVDGLLLAVAPTSYVADLSLLRKVAGKRLTMLSGEDFHLQAMAWRNWWRIHKVGFAYCRDRIELTKENAIHAMLSWQDGDLHMTFRGAERPPLAGKPAAGARQFILSASQMMDLVGKLQSLGFMGRRGQEPGTQTMGTVELRLFGSRTLMRMPKADRRQIGLRMRDMFVAVAKDERWQLYRDPATQPDPSVFWRAERKWLAKNPGQEQQRLKERILVRLASLESDGHAGALEDLLAIPDLPKKLSEQDGMQLTKVAQTHTGLDESVVRMFELAVVSPGEKAWRQALTALIARPASAQRAQALRRVFALLGADRLLAALSHDNIEVRLAANREVARVRDLRATAQLLELLKSKDVREVVATIYTLGRLRTAEARDPLLGIEQATKGVVRQQAWLSLARVGGRQVPRILLRAARSPDAEDRRAALRAMGEMKHDTLARYLVERYATDGPDASQLMGETGAALRNQGALMARKWVRAHLPKTKGSGRLRLLLLAAEFHDVDAIPDLVRLLQDPKHSAFVAQRLAEITGLELMTRDQRGKVVANWYVRNRNKSRMIWMLDALRQGRYRTTLKAKHLVAGSGIGAVPELARLLTTVREPHLRVMVASVLREVTGKEFGRVGPNSTPAQLAAIAERYRFLAETQKSAAK